MRGRLGVDPRFWVVGALIGGSVYSPLGAFGAQPARPARPDVVSRGSSSTGPRPGYESIPVQAPFEPQLRMLTPPPVSGRRLKGSDGVQASDVLARVRLFRDNVDLIRVYMGVAEASPPLLRASSAQPREAYFQALNLIRRVRKLSFEQLRVSVDFPDVIESQAGFNEVFEIVDTCLQVVLEIKNRLGIETVVGEVPQPDTTTTTEVFNAVVEAGADINGLLERRTQPTEIYSIVTYAVSLVSSMHADKTRKLLPVEPDFVPNKTNADVYRRLVSSLHQVQTLAQAMGDDTLQFEVAEAQIETATSDDVSDLAALLVAEVSYLHARMTQDRYIPKPYHPGRRFPSHVYQRLVLFEEILGRVTRAVR